LYLIVVPQQSSGWQHNYSTKTRLTGCANEQSMYSLMSMVFYYEGRSKDKYGIGIVHVIRQLNKREEPVLDTNAENNCLKLPEMSN
jgi:hypothetical protein